MKSEIFNEYKIIDYIPHISFIVGSRHKGLLLFAAGEIKQAYKEYRVYGITKNENRWFASIRHGKTKIAKLVSFKIINNDMVDFKDIIKLVDGIHQIDFVNDDLVMADADHNRLISYKNFYNEEVSNKVEYFLSRRKGQKGQ